MGRALGKVWTLMAEKRIRSSSSNKYYRIRQRSTRYGRKGEIMGLWHNEGAKGAKKVPRDKDGRFANRNEAHKKKGFFRRLFGC